MYAYLHLILYHYHINYIIIILLDYILYHELFLKLYYIFYYYFCYIDCNVSMKKINVCLCNQYNINIYYITSYLESIESLSLVFFLSIAVYLRFQH